MKKSLQIKTYYDILTSWGGTKMENDVLFSCREDDFYFHHTLTRHPEAGDDSFRSHSHPMYEIYYFIRGEADFVVEGHIHALQRGGMIVTECGQAHNILIRSQEAPYERIALLFSPRLLPDGFLPLLEAIHGGRNGIFFGEADQQWLETCFSLLQTPTLNGIAMEERIRAIIGVLLAKAAEKMALGQENAPEKDDLVSQMIQFIHGHLQDEWQLSDLERALFRDKIYLNRRFKAVMGCGIWEYTMRKRVFAAQQQLRQSRSISAAFAASGFQDYSTFYRRYKKYIGVPPSEDIKNLE